jgi:hypothetical protein
LKELQSFIYKTPEYVARLPSKQLNQQLNSILGGPGRWLWPDVYDCFLTAVCANHSLPFGTNQSVLMTDAIYEKTIAQGLYDLVYLYTYNNSEFSKLAMGNTAWHIAQNIQQRIENSDEGLKFALFAGHDTTLMPFLAAVLGNAWDREWSPYASMISIEVYKAADETSSLSGYYFRMVYNGKAITFPACTQALCDLHYLLDALSFGQEHMPCATTSSHASTTTIPSSSSHSAPSSSLLDNSTWIITVIISLIIGMLFGAILLHIAQRWKFPSPSISTTIRHIQLTPQPSEQSFTLLHSTEI